jgi:hypothetical protein
MTLEAYNLAEMLTLARWAENISSCSGDKEKEEKFKKYKETLMGRETYKTVTIGMILLAAEELEDMKNEEIMEFAETLCRGAPTRH